MKKRTKVAATALVTVSLAAGAVVASRSNASNADTDDGESADSSTIRTSTVRRETLTTEDRYDGTIKYANSRRIGATAAATSTSGGGGAGQASGATNSAGVSVLTASALVGDVLGRGDVAFAINGEPTVVMYGATPMYRSLSTNSDPGADVRMVEENLAALGYDADGVMIVDNEFDGDTAAAVERWQADLGVEVTGEVDVNDVTMLPGPAVVSASEVGIGEQVGGNVLDVVISAAEHHVLVHGVTDEERRLSNVITANTVAAGDVLYDLDDVAVVALLGDTALGRDLAEDDQGDDVRMLQENLVAMGYDGVSPEEGEDGEPATLAVTGTFDAVTRAAVEQLQFDVGQEVDGVVELGDVAVVPEGSTVVGRLDTSVEGGDDVAVRPHESVLQMSRSERVVAVDIAMEDQDELLVGTEVRVAVPSVGDVRGVVRSVSPTASTGPSGETAAESATVTVSIEVLDPVDLAQIEAPVDVYLERTLADAVLVVPVSALVALSTGGFAVQIVDPAAPGGLRYVAVEPGQFADNMVEISGEGIDESTQVVTV
jgi:peptidoglycan hydrolase-like protein with peptidoglycan-binding domain